MNTEGLTKYQIRALEFITESIEQRGLSPTLGEIGEGIGMPNRGHVHRIVTGLRDRGRINWLPRCSRSITLIGDNSRHKLPPDLQFKLEAYCNAHNERPSDVLADALSLHFDALEASGSLAQASQTGGV